MIITTTTQLENKEVSEYIGIVTGEVVIGANFVKDFFLRALLIFLADEALRMRKFSSKLVMLLL